MVLQMVLRKIKSHFYQPHSTGGRGTLNRRIFIKVVKKSFSGAVGSPRSWGCISAQDKRCFSGLDSKGFSSDESLHSMPIWILVKIQEIEEM